MPTRTVRDAELAFLKQMLGVTVGHIDDLRLKFYEGVLNGTVSVGGPRLQLTPAIGQYLMAPALPTGSSGSQATSLNELTFEPLYVDTNLSVDQITSYQDTGAAGSFIRFGIYKSDGTNGMPGTLVIGTAQISTATGGQVNSAAISATALTPGLYWAAFVTQAVAGATVRAITGTGFSAPGLSATDSANVVSWKVTQAGVSGALPATATPVLARSGGLPHYEIGLRRSA